MTAGDRIGVFKQLGHELRMILDKESTIYSSGTWAEVCQKAYITNAWFTESNVNFRLTNIAEQLRESTLDTWLQKYALPQDWTGKTVGVIAAGNIPAAGF